ncbi:uncharacterized protein OCT59_019500 [Rhizophagus irregularis]|uniref:Uncharacterized protein n=1 Tax=Rhizophagus irregularis (strain DAOM 197198w) TaxID=1432141 RepID=A0A015LV04_RHIIW|nr:hypothetical protein RirG_197560 [Rhizophagus irregularis DAOM 197198w]UZO27299.1 hypothetical protein OCT59_019500 [Rhizophagus irregularis]GBC51500.1 hypothetical protein GLOIN_2v1769826 [Rhizophagus irregularis DAOM 181602=DAOM 197198]CAG8689279.1 8670_t:CDS:1 [Rhizophagus irregularis]
MKEQKNLRNLLKQELLSKISGRVTPNEIKKKKANNRKLNITILNQIKYFRNLKKNHEIQEVQEGIGHVENQEVPGRENEAQEGIGHVVVNQEVLRRVNEKQGLGRVNKTQKGLGLVIENQEEFVTVNENHEKPDHVNENLIGIGRVNKTQKGLWLVNENHEGLRCVNEDQESHRECKVKG